MADARKLPITLGPFHLEEEPETQTGWQSEGPAPGISAAEKEEQDMTQGRRNHSASLKARVALEAMADS